MCVGWLPNLKLGEVESVTVCRQRLRVGERQSSSCVRPGSRRQDVVTSAAVPPSAGRWWTITAIGGRNYTISRHDVAASHTTRFIHYAHDSRTTPTGKRPTERKSRWDWKRLIRLRHNSSDIRV